MTSEVIVATQPVGEPRHMTAYAVANLRSVDQNAEIRDYLLRIDDTLDPFGGHFLVHGKTPQVVDGDLPGVVVIIEFPDLAAAQAWYASPGYQAILPLRLRNSDGGAVIVDGTPDGYRAASLVVGSGVASS
jgi:uncharacterized protein (DUF1330 family)